MGTVLTKVITRTMPDSLWNADGITPPPPTPAPAQEEGDCMLTC
jgi:hypothetical protein